MNRILSAVAVLMAAFVVLSCDRDSEGATRTRPEPTVKDTQSAYIPGLATVKLTEEQADAFESNRNVIPAALQPLGVVCLERMLPDAGEFEARTRAMGLHRWYRLEYTEDIAPTKAAASISQMPGIECFEPVARVKTCALPFNDPLLPNQWHYISNDKSKSGADVDVLPVWDEFTTGRSDVIVAVVDGGIDYNHEDLQGQVLLDGSYNFIHHNSYISAHGHGTHVAGTIAALNNNGKGVCGLAGGNCAENTSGVKLLSLQVFEPNPDPKEDDISAMTTDFSSAIKWAADHGAIICSNSWGSDYKSEAQAMTGVTSDYFKSCVDYFNTYAGFDKDGNQVAPMAGGLVVFAAGNDGWQYAHPCDYEGVLAVGAIDASGARAYYSNYGSWVDICAPGGSYSTQQILSTVPDSQYAYYQGTSMACPHVSGVAALVVSACGGPGFTREMLLERLLGGTRRGVVPAYSKIGELVSAYRAIAWGENFVPEKVQTFTVQSKSNIVTPTWKMGASASGKKAFGYLVALAENESDLTSLDPSAIPSNVVTQKLHARDNAVGDDLSLTFSDLAFSKDYYVAIAGYDVNDNYSEFSPIKSVSTGINHAPVIIIDNSDMELKAFETIKLPFAIDDEDGHDFVFSLDGDRPWAYFSETPSSGKELVIEAYKADAGDYSIKLTAEDSYGAKAEKTIAITILPNNKPQVVNAPGNEVFAGKGKVHTINLSEVFNDPDGEPLKYGVQLSLASILHPSITGTTLTMTSLALGKVGVTLSATDIKGDFVETSFDVLVRDPSIEVQTYPNPCKNDLYIAPGEDETVVEVLLQTATGTTVLNKSFPGISAFNPLHLKMDGLAPGRYNLSVTFDGKTHKNTIIKR